jgi:periplasmic divalent cation tolerance protein
MSAIVCHTTAPNKDVAHTLANHLLTERLAACVSILGPASSLYHWNQAIETAEEYTLTIKTDDRHIDSLTTAIQNCHPYEVPEILWTEPILVESKYAAWIEASVNQDAAPK